MDVNESLRGKHIVITGGSSGIGRELVNVASGASGAGVNVIFTYNKGEDRAGEVSVKTGAIYFPLMLGDAQSTYDFLGQLHSPVDYFIANAGVELSGGLEKHTLEEMQRIVTVNLLGNMYLLRQLVVGQGKMAEKGQISVIGSIAAGGNHDQVAYSASKSGLRGFVGALQYDKLANEDGLNIKLIEPAFVRTSMTERYLRVVERSIKRKGGDELFAQFKQEGLLMEVDYAAQEIFKLAIDPKVRGRRTIPAGIDMQGVRKKYF